MSAPATERFETLLTPAEVCAALRISYATFRRYVERGDLEVVRLGQRNGATLRVRPEALERLLAGEERAG